MSYKKNIYKYALTLGGIDIPVFENEVMIVVNCYDVMPPNPHYCKSNKSKCYCLEKFFKM